MPEKNLKGGLADVVIKQFEQGILGKFEGIEDAQGHPLYQDIKSDLQALSGLAPQIEGMISPDEWTSLENLAIDNFNQRILHGRLTPAQIDLIKQFLAHLISALINSGALTAAVAPVAALKAQAPKEPVKSADQPKEPAKPAETPKEPAGDDEQSTKKKSK